MALDNGDGRLSCGTTFEALVAQVTTADDGLTDSPHQARCRDCRRAVRELTATWGDVRAYAQQPVRAPQGLSARIMAEVRGLAARLRGAAVLIGLQGDTQIAESVLAQIARRAASAVPGVALATALSAAADPADRRHVRFSLRLVVTFGPAIETLAASVRTEVARHVAAQAGVEASQIDIAIEDVIPGL